MTAAPKYVVILFQSILTSFLFKFYFLKVEIDEYRDYEKAIGALKEGLKYLSKESPPSGQTREMAGSFEKRIAMIEKFVQARKAAKKDPATMVAICDELLADPQLEE
jgi:intraflagellar transport protein 140